MKIKLFTSTNAHNLEDNVNKFLKDNSGKIKITQITNSECEMAFTIMIVYEPKMDVTE